MEKVKEYTVCLRFRDEKCGTVWETIRIEEKPEKDRIERFYQCLTLSGIRQAKRKMDSKLKKEGFELKKEFYSEFHLSSFFGTNFNVDKADKILLYAR